MNRHSLAMVLLAAVVPLAGCVGWTSIPAKERKLASGYYVTPQIEWSAFKQGNVETWTVHGPPIEAVLVASALADGKPLLKPVGYKEKMPLFRSAMAASEVAEMVVETLLRGGYGSVELLGVRPQPFGGKPGFRFDLRLVASNGLELSGLGAGAIVGGKLYLIVYRAPKLHYFDTYEPTVEKLIASARFE